MRRCSQSAVKCKTSSGLATLALDILQWLPSSSNNSRPNAAPTPKASTTMAPPKHPLPWSLAPLLLAPFAHAQNDASQCSSSSSAAYNATFTTLGCYNDSSVSILSAAKLSTIAMTPSYCASWCGERGYAYGGINFGTQCFCDNEPDFGNANEIDESRCQPCVTDPENKCGGGYM